MQVTFGTNQSTITTGWGHNTDFHWSDEEGGQHSICQWGCCTRDSWTDNSDSRAELDSRTAQNTSRQRNDIRTGEKPSSSRYGVKTVTRSQMNNLNVTNTDMTWTDSSGQLFQLRTSGSSPPSFSTDSPAETNHKSECIMRFDGDSTLVSTNATITNNKNNSSRGGGQQHRVSGHNSTVITGGNHVNGGTVRGNLVSTGTQQGGGGGNHHSGGTVHGCMIDGVIPQQQQQPPLPYSYGVFPYPDAPFYPCTPTEGFWLFRGGYRLYYYQRPRYEGYF